MTSLGPRIIWNHLFTVDNLPPVIADTGISSMTKDDGVDNFVPLPGRVAPISGYSTVLLDLSLTVKAAPHECVIRTGQP